MITYASVRGGCRVAWSGRSVGNAPKAIGDALFAHALAGLVEPAHLESRELDLRLTSRMCPRAGAERLTDRVGANGCA